MGFSLVLASGVRLLKICYYEMPKNKEKLENINRKNYINNVDERKVSVSVKYLDNKSKMTQISQYELVLHKDDNWKIVG